MIEAALRQTGEPGLSQVTHVEIRMQPEAEGHRRSAAVVDGGADLQSTVNWPHVHLHQKGEGISLEGFIGAGEAETNPALVVKQLQCPGKIPGKAVLLERVVDPIDREHVAGKIAADRKQHRNTAADAVRRIGITLLIEIKHLALTATPLADDSSPLRDDPQPVTAGGVHILPVGIGSGLLGEGHRHPPRCGKSGLIK